MGRHPRNGFTLLELLVVVGVIGVLATVVLVALTSIRAKARDARRKADISQLGKFMIISCYVPDSGDGDYDAKEIIDEFKAKYPQTAGRLPQIPRDPSMGSEDQLFYRYTVTTSPKKCALYGNLEYDNEPVTLSGATAPAPGGGTGVLEAANEGWNGSKKYFQISN